MKNLKAKIISTIMLLFLHSFFVGWESKCQSFQMYERILSQNDTNIRHNHILSTMNGDKDIIWSWYYNIEQKQNMHSSFQSY